MAMPTMPSVLFRFSCSVYSRTANGVEVGAGVTVSVGNVEGGESGVPLRDAGAAGCGAFFKINKCSPGRTVVSS